MAYTVTQRNAAFDAVKAVILKKIQSEVPSIFESTAEAALPAHTQDILDISNAAIDSLVQPSA